MSAPTLQGQQSWHPRRKHVEDFVRDCARNAGVFPGVSFRAPQSPDPVWQLLLL
jgi:hypothetical protein